MPKVRKGHKDKKKEKKKRAKERAAQERVSSELMKLSSDQVDAWVKRNTKNINGVRSVLLELARVVVYLRDYTELTD